MQIEGKLNHKTFIFLKTTVKTKMVGHLKPWQARKSQNMKMVRTYIILYSILNNNVTSVSIFIGCWPWSIYGHAHRWRQIHVRSRQQICFSFFMPQTLFNKPFEFLLYKTNRLHFSVPVYCNWSQKTSQRVKNNCHATRLRLVSYFLFFSRCDVITVCTHGKM